MEQEHLTEKQIEQRLITKVKDKGGLAIKLNSMAGLPDRLVLMPKGQIMFVELKAPGRKMSAQQLKRKRQLEELGFLVHCIDSYEGVNKLLQEKRD